MTSFKDSIVERWLPVPGYEGWYSISDLGKIRRDLSKTRGKAGKILKTHTAWRGYIAIQLSKDGIQKIFNFPALVLLTFVGPRPETYEINHINGIKNDNRLLNLEYCTKSQNCLHRCRVLGHNQGEKNGSCKLTKSQILNIRALAAKTNISHYEIGKLFGIGHAQVSRIASRKAWAHIGEQDL